LVNVFPVRRVAEMKQAARKEVVGLVYPHFSHNRIFPGNANLLIGAWQNANQEIGVPRFATI